MATRISFSTTYPDRMGPLRGKFTRFPEKIIAGLDMDDWIEGGYRWDMRDAGYNIQISNVTNVMYPKTTTIRSNYDYWKSKEGQLLQPFFWAGRPSRSKHVVFCPEVRLVSVLRINLDIYEKNIFITAEENDGVCKKSFISLLNWKSVSDFTKDEGFDQPDHFWMWFNQDFDGAYLEIENI